MHRRALITLIVLLFAAGLVACLRLMVGGDGLAFPSGEHAVDIWSLRATRLGVGAVVGVCLAVAGVLLQSLLRNPLASPDLIGMSAGAGLAVMIVALVAHAATGELASGVGRGPASLVGGMAALGFVYLLSQRRGLIDPVSMILVGVIVSVICGSVTLLLQSLLPDRGYLVSRWFMGRLDEDVPLWALVGWGLAAVAGTGWSLRLAPAMDAASLGEDEARSVGVHLSRLRAMQFVLAGVLTAGAVALAGPIGFVGLVCPHAVRLAAGPKHAPLVLGSALAGVVLVVGADAGVKAVELASGRLPIGVVTSLVGGPVFLWLLIRGRSVA